jgi:NAD(P)-dependent dehydrogenase (short-subunit alcohol dehydrogenase family)
MSPPTFKDNVVIVTGASSGIGLQVALQLADQGAWLALAARRVERLEAVAEQCRQRDGAALVVPTDVSQQGQCQELVQRTVEEYGRLDTLINDAGVTMWSRFEDMQNLEPFESVMGTNYFGSIYCTYYALPYLKRSQGRIVAIASLAGKSGIPTRSGYAASKHAVVGFFDSLRIEVAEHGISVTVIYPDYVASETRVRAFGPEGEPLGKSPIQEGAVMTAETCAALILEAAARRKRQAILSRRGKILLWVKLIAPGLVDRMALRAIRRGV